MTPRVEKLKKRNIFKKLEKIVISSIKLRFLAIGVSNGATGGGVNSGGRVPSTSQNRPSHHKYKSPKQFELKQS